MTRAEPILYAGVRTLWLAGILVIGWEASPAAHAAAGDSRLPMPARHPGATLHYAPTSGVLGDVIPFYHDGVYHVFNLKGSSWGHISSPLGTAAAVDVRVFAVGTVLECFINDADCFTMRVFDHLAVLSFGFPEIKVRVKDLSVTAMGDLGGR